MGAASRRKGAKGELEFIQRHLLRFWPFARRNIDQFSVDKRDCVETGRLHWQIKRTERLELWAAIKQAEDEAAEGMVPLVAFRRNRSEWYVIAPAEFAVEAFAAADQPLAHEAVGA